MQYKRLGSWSDVAEYNGKVTQNRYAHKITNFKISSNIMWNFLEVVTELNVDIGCVWEQFFKDSVVLMRKKIVEWYIND